MADVGIEQLKEDIQSNINTNNNQEITGAVLQGQLIDTVDTLKGYTDDHVSVSQKTITLKDWTKNTAYVVGNQVQTGTPTKYYRCVTAHTSGSSFDATEQANWAEITDFEYGGTSMLSINVGNEETPIFQACIKLTDFGAEGPHANNVGDVYYNTDIRTLRIRVALSGTPTFKTVPFIDGAIYIYNNELFSWDGSNLVKCTNESEKILPFYVGQYVDSTGAIVEANTSWYSSEYLPINTMTIQEIELRVVSQASTVNYIAFYNSGFSFISGVNGSGADSNNKIKQMPSIPSGAAFVKFTSVFNPPKVLGLCDNIGLSYCLGVTHRINDVELDLKNVKHILNQYLDANGNVVTTPNAFVRTGYIKTANLTISAIRVHTRSDVPSIGYICFYDANYTFISKVDGSSADASGNIVTVPSIPENAAYMRMCAWQWPILLTATYNSLLGANNVLYANENPIKHILGQYFDGDGNIGYSPNPFMRTGFIKTANLTITKIKVHIRPDVPSIGYISFFDDNFNFVSKVDGANADANNDVTTIPAIPSGASYMAMCTYENPIVFEGYYYNEKLDVNDVLYAITEFDKPYKKVADKAVFLGDSISSVLGGNYGAPVGQLLQEWGVIGNVEIKAHAGDVILDGLTQLENATTVNPDIVFVAFGVNDWGLTELDGVGEWFTESITEGVAKRSYDITSNTIKSRFNQLYAAIRNKYPLARVIMQTVIKKGDNSRTEGGVYVYSPDYFTKNNNMYLDEIRGAILDMPRVCNVESVDMWQLCELDPTISANKAAYFVDFTHPNANGHKLMATAMYKYLISH